MKSKNPLATLVVWLALAPIAVAAAGAGAIAGRVFNPATGEYMNNAEVRLVGTNQMTYTSQDGSFSFIGVPAGTASITASYSGYDTANETFNVATGQTAVREINLTAAVSSASKDGVVKLDAFAVSSAREGNSKAIMAQRRDMNIITSVSSDIFGEVMDGNVGDFLKYLPGVDLDYIESEPRGLRLGGMDSQYVGVSMDGMRTASADAFRGDGAASRATSLEGFSITSVESIEINRTASPENDADQVAGGVNMRTKRAFDRKGRAFSYNFNVNINGEEFSLRKQPGLQDGRENGRSYKWFPNWQADYAESFFNQKFGILLSASRHASYTEQTFHIVNYNRGVETGPINPALVRGHDLRPMVVQSLSFVDSPKTIKKDALLLTADWRATQKLTLSLNLSYSRYEGIYWTRNFDFNAASNNQNQLNGRGTVGGDGLLTIIAPRDLTQPAGAINGEVLNNGVANLSNGGGSGAKLTYTRQYVPRFEYRSGRWTVDGAFAFSKSLNNYDALERGFINSEGGAVAAGWIATRPNVQSWEWTIRQIAGNDWNDLRNFTNTDTRAGGTRVNTDNRTWITEKWTGTLNARWMVPGLERFPTVLKFGGKWDEENRYNRTDTDMDIWSYVGPGGNAVQRNPNTLAMFNTSFGNWANVGPQFVAQIPWDGGTTNFLHTIGLNGRDAFPPRVSRVEVARLFYERPDLFVHTMTPENFYSSQYANARRFKQTITSGYLQADVRLSRRLGVRFGSRVEQTEGRYKERDPLTRNQLIALGVPLNAPGTSGGRPLTIAGMRTMFETNPFIIRRGSATEYFPSFVAKYQIAPNFDWQAGVNKGISRPGIGNLTGLWVINEINQSVTVPNPKLQPEHLKNHQMRFAYYFQGRSPGQLSVQMNMIETTNFITSRAYSAEEFGVGDPDFANYTFNAQSNVAGLQRYKNLELSYQQTLGFLPSEYLRGISVGATYTRSYANQLRNNLAPHRWTGRLGYRYRRFAANLAFIWVDDRPINGVDYRYWGAMTKWDGGLTFDLNKYATLYVTTRNPTNQKDLHYETPPGAAKGVGKHLRFMDAYGDNWIFGLRGRF